MTKSLFIHRKALRLCVVLIVVLISLCGCVTSKGHSRDADTDKVTTLAAP